MVIPDGIIDVDSEVACERRKEEDKVKLMSGPELAEYTGSVIADLKKSRIVLDELDRLITLKQALNFDDETKALDMRCEGCGSKMFPWKLQDVYKPKIRYFVCTNCLVGLVNLALSKKQFAALIAAGHRANEFFLHEDFYDEDGNALQPNRETEL